VRQREEIQGVLQAMNAQSPPANLADKSDGKPVGWVRRDIIAGLTVAVVDLPQAMAYALIAGVAPVYGLYATIIQGLLGAILSDNRHIRTGPTNTHALLVASAVSQIASLSGEQFLVVVATLTFVKGMIQLLAGLFRTGALFKFVSPSTVMGISAGAGILIMVGQVPSLLGWKLSVKSSLPGLSGTVSSMWQSGVNIQWRSVLIGVATLVLMVVVPKWYKRFPTALLCVALATGLVWLTGWQESVAVVKEIPRHLPHLVWPGSMQIPWGVVLPSAAALAVLGMIETVAISRTLGGASKPNGSDGINRDLVAQGIANVVSSAVAAIPGSASFSRSMLDRVAGSVSRLSGIVNAIAVLVMVLLFAPLGKYLPLSVLAGVLVVIAWKLIDWSFIARVRQCHRADFAVFLISMGATVFLPLQYAVFLGIGANIAYQLRVASRLRAVELTVNAAGQFREITEPGAQSTGNGSSDVRILQLDGNLFFGLRDELSIALDTLARSTARVHIIRLRNTHAIDLSILDTLGEHIQSMRRSDRHVLLCGIRPSLMSLLQKHPLFTDGRGTNLFPVGDSVFESLQRALDRAKQIGVRIETAHTEPPWVYVI
jgi:sulfate permease, SulP family